MRRIACFLNACLMTVLFVSLLVSANLLLTHYALANESSFQPTKSECGNLSAQFCAHTDYRSRKRSIFEYAGRCFRTELDQIPKEQVATDEKYELYLESIQAKFQPEFTTLNAAYTKVKRALEEAIQSSLKLDKKTKDHYISSIEKTQILLPSEHVKIGGSEEFKKTCGEFGLEDNGSFVQFSNGDQYVLICPGRWISALENSSDCNSKKINPDSLLYTLSHELGHSIGGNYAKYNLEKSSWMITENIYLKDFSQCMKKKFPEYPQEDYGEASADYWASETLARLLSSPIEFTPIEKRPEKLGKMVIGLCGTELSDRHLPGDLRIERLITSQKSMQETLGCSPQGEKETCSL